MKYHNIEVKIIDWFLDNGTYFVRIQTPEGNRWSNGWVTAEEIDFPPGENFTDTMHKIESQKLAEDMARA